MATYLPYLCVVMRWDCPNSQAMNNTHVHVIKKSLTLGSHETFKSISNRFQMIWPSCTPNKKVSNWFGQTCSKVGLELIWNRFEGYKSIWVYNSRFFYLICFIMVIFFYILSTENNDFTWFYRTRNWQIILWFKVPCECIIHFIKNIA